jgi:hypothetical protein
MDPLLDILMITCNRAGYTALSLKQLLDTCDDRMRVWIWQNGNHAETLGVIASFRNHPRIAQVHISNENKKLREPTNWFWQHSSAPLVAKVDDDCLVPPGWASTLVSAHRDAPNLGLVACWLFYDEDFVPDLANRKLLQLPGGRHQIVRNCYVQGSGYVMKRAVIDQLGLLGPSESFTQYCIRAASAGWVNGWYFPFIHEEHMDDPRSPYCDLRSEDDFARNKPLTAVNHNVRSLEEWKNHNRWCARTALASSPDPLQHTGWRLTLRNGVKRLKRAAGWPEPWRIANRWSPAVGTHLRRRSSPRSG